MLSCLRRVVKSAACFSMMDSDRASISLCHEVNTRAAFARARFAYSLARSLSKCRPVVRTASISFGGERGLPKRAFMALIFAIVARRCRSVFVVLRALSNAIPEPARPPRGWRSGTKSDWGTFGVKSSRAGARTVRPTKKVVDFGPSQTLRISTDEPKGRP